MQKRMTVSTILNPLTLLTVATLLTGCAVTANDSVTATRSLEPRKACAGALADLEQGDDPLPAQAACLELLDILKAGFGE